MVPLKSLYCAGIVMNNLTTGTIDMGISYYGSLEVSVLCGFCDVDCTTDHVAEYILHM